MAETYTIESADDSVPIDPRLLRELRDMLRRTRTSISASG